MKQNYDQLENQFPSVFQSWHIVREIGRGSFGEVYEVGRESIGYMEKAAIKHVSYPRDQYDLQRICSDLGTSDEAAVRDDVFQTIQEFRREYELMRKFSGQTHIVSCEDFQAIPKKDMPGYDIFIRMELLTPVSEVMLLNKLNREEAVRLGIDICDALKLLESEGIVHRDIKPENLFINEYGDYKLGDFGAARSLPAASATLSVKGTPAYMAPEIALQQKAGPWTDIYSLGLVMYRLMNNNQPPFVEGTQSVSTVIREQASSRRISGEKLPPPAKADPALANVILKACAPDPKDRYQTAEEFRSALAKVCPEAEKNRSRSKKESSIRTKGEIRTTVLTTEEEEELRRQEEARLVEEAKKAEEQIRINEENRKKRNKKIAVITAVCVALAAVIGVSAILIKQNADKKALYQQAQQYELNEEYEKAEEIYTELGDFSDAANKVKEVRNAGSLKKGKTELAGNNLLEAQKIFQGLPDLPEAQDLLAETNRRINEDKQLKQAADDIREAEDQHGKGSKESLNAAINAYTAAQTIYKSYAETDETAAEKAAECGNWIRYINAELLLMGKDYSKARYEFSELADDQFHDAAERVQEVNNTEQFEKAKDLFDKKEYDKAKEIYADLTEKGYPGAAERLEETQRYLDYQTAENLLQNNEYEEAAKAYEALNGFQDSEKAAKYARALQALKEKQYATAAQGFTELGEYREARRIGQEAATTESRRQQYEAANDHFANGRYQQAKDAYDAAEDYENAKAMSAECDRYLKLERAKELMAESSYSAAYDLLKDLDLENSGELAKQCLFGVFCAEVSNMKEPGVLLKSCFRYIYDQPLPMNSRKIWAEQMMPRELKGSEIASGFANAPQFTSIEMTYEQRVKTLYDVLLNRRGREEDDYTREHGVYEDAQICVDYLNANMTMTAVLNYIVRSGEFADICRDDGLPVGEIAITESRDRDYGISRFVMDCYQLCLRRGADPEGLNTYTSEILDQQVSLEKIMITLATSQESQSYYPENVEYVRMLYREMLGREAGDDEVAIHLGALERGVDRKQLAISISDSPECANYLDKYLLTDKQRDTIRSVNGRYNQACQSMETAEYEKARDLFLSIPDYRDSTDKAEECRIRIFCRDMTGDGYTNARINRCFETIAQWKALDDAGKAEWAAAIARSSSGVEIIRSYIGNPYFNTPGCSNADRTAAVWYVMLGARPAAEDEQYRNFTAALDIGMDAEYEAFNLSLRQEYRDLCAEEGIDASEVTVQELRNVSYPLSYLVYLSYQQVLKRAASPDEYNYWCGKYLSGEVNGKSLMKITLGSEEAKNTLPTMEEYINTAYLYTLGRVAKPEELNAGMEKSRATIAEELTSSGECSKYLESIGLK